MNYVKKNECSVNDSTNAMYERTKNRLKKISLNSIVAVVIVKGSGTYAFMAVTK
jgi:hypothetical protein